MWPFSFCLRVTCRAWVIKRYVEKQASFQCVRSTRRLPNGSLDFDFGSGRDFDVGG